MNKNQLREEIGKKGGIVLLGLALSVASYVEEVKAFNWGILIENDKNGGKVEQQRKTPTKRCGEGLDGYVENYDCSKKYGGFQNDVHIDNSYIRGNAGIQFGSE